MSWEKPDAGSVLSHTFELEAKEKGFFSGAPAHITFRILSSAVLLEAYSTPLFPLDILADKPAESNLEMVYACLLSIKHYTELSCLMFFPVTIFFLVLYDIRWMKLIQRQRGCWLHMGKRCQW